MSEINKEYQSVMVYMKFAREVAAALIYPSFDFDAVLEEIMYIYTEHDKYYSVECEDPVEFRKMVKDEIDNRLMPFWFRTISNGVLPADAKGNFNTKKFNEVFEYYYDREEYEKCGIMKRAKEDNLKFFKKGF